MKRVYYNFCELKDIIKRSLVNKYMLVASKRTHEEFKEQLEAIGVPYVLFSQFGPNPQYDDILEGLKILNDNKFELLISIGGGSAIDTAKAIKAFSNMNPDESYLNQPILANNQITLVGIPTTAGSGSEATKYSIIYQGNVKYTLTDPSLCCDYVILDYHLLITLPPYQRKATVFDALCQAIEGYWAKSSNSESDEYALKAMELLFNNMEAYVQNSNDDDVLNDIMIGSYLAGKTISISQTTAAHAMCYKITTTFGYAHGHSVGMTITSLFQFIYDNVDRSDNPQQLLNKLNQIALTLGYDNVPDCINAIEQRFDNYGLERISITKEELDMLVNSINRQRLYNNPIPLTKEDIAFVYVKSVKQVRR
ncbi:MAG: phosphonoacetaldehyde reductase [Erysipelotrichaceae bacterium]